MPDRPDWSKYLPGSERHSLEDMSELAARLWSPSVYDRRGEVVWMNNFADGLSQWRPVEGGDEDSVILSADYPNRGHYCAKLITGTVGIIAAGIYAYVYPPVLNKWGLEVGFAIGQAFSSFTIDMGYYDGTYAYRGYALIDGGNDLLKLYDENGDLQTIAEVEVLHSLFGLYHVLKLVIDTEDGTYERILLDSNEYDVSAYSLYPTLSSAAPCNGIRVIFTGDGVGLDHARVGYVISTANEP